MNCRLFVGLLLGALAWGQATNSKPGTTPSKPEAASASAAKVSTPKAAGAATVSPETPVITIAGLCDPKPAAQAVRCRTVVTRAEFEKLMAAVAPNAPPSTQKQLATRYGMLLVMVHKAHEMRLDQDPQYEERARVSGMSVLANELGQALQEKASHIPDKEVEDYYQKNQVVYQEAELQRIFIPLSRQPEGSKEKLSDEEAKKSQQESQETMKKEADLLRVRASAGGDFDKLQQEAYDAAGLKSKVPTKVGKVRRSSLPADQASVMDLKSGEVSQLVTTPSGYFVYKVGEKETLTLDKVREEILGTLRQQRLQDSMQAIQQSATPELNEKYFTEANPSAPKGPAQPPEGGKPPAQSPESLPK